MQVRQVQSRRLLPRRRLNAGWFGPRASHRERPPVLGSTSGSRPCELGGMQTAGGHDAARQTCRCARETRQRGRAGRGEWCVTTAGCTGLGCAHLSHCVHTHTMRLSAVRVPSFLPAGRDGRSDAVPWLRGAGGKNAGARLYSVAVLVVEVDMRLVVFGHGFGTRSRAWLSCDVRYSAARHGRRNLGSPIPICCGVQLHTTAVTCTVVSTVHTAVL